MIRIAIVDDNNLHSIELEKYILNYINLYPSIEIEIDVFFSGISFLKYIHSKKETHQLLFLDIEMENMNGIETARQIRKNDKTMTIIYVTSYDQYTMESFEVAPFRYLLKPLTQKQIDQVLAQALEEITLNNQYLFFKYQNNQYQLKSEDILSISSEKGRLLRIKTEDNGNAFLFYGKIKEIEKQINPLIFIKVNQGTILNLNYVHIISGVEIHMTNGDVFTISRGQKKNVKNAYHDFIKRRIGL